MNVIVITQTEHFAQETTITKMIDSFCLSVTELMYQQYTLVIGACLTADEARKIIEKSKKDKLVAYGPSALDDENIEDMHDYFTWGTATFDIEEG